MRKKTLVWSFAFLLLLSLVAFLNMTVTTRQGINYKTSSVELPLYLKVLNFYDRHFNYKWLAKRITGHLEAKEEKIFRLFQWTHETIRPQPEGLPIMDDHVWNVYVRGYGVSDNFHDLFSTLCNYIGVDGFFTSFHSEDSSGMVSLSFVRLERGWVVFDPYKGVYFNNKAGDWATIEEIKKENWKLEQLGQADIPDSYYKQYLEALPNIEDIGLKRANTQSPLNRLKSQVHRWISSTRPLFE